MRADIGIALDGDADRVVISDERGRLVDGDQLIAVIAESWLKDERLAKPGVVSTIMSNFGLERLLAGLGLKLVRVPVGDRYVLETMRESRATTSAASRPGTSSCPITPRRETALSPPCRCLPW